jgi:hypothetical protein
MNVASITNTNKNKSKTSCGLKEETNMSDEEQILPMRTKGTVVPRPKVNVSGAEPGQQQNQSQNQRPKGVITKGTVPLPPNRICYPDLYADWKKRVDAGGSRKLHHCKRCDGILHWEENHVCPGFIPKYPVLPSTEEAMEEHKAIREYIRETEGDWDDDQYDPTTPGDVPKNPDEEDSGIVLNMSEDEWFRRKFGFIP